MPPRSCTSPTPDAPFPMITFRQSVGFFAVAAGTLALRAEVVLPALFSDHAVLQKSSGTAIWGRAEPGERVEISIGGRSARTIAGADGAWRAALDLKDVAPGPHDLIAEGRNRLIVSDVIVGEVWLCAGQSNMDNGLEDKEERRDNAQPLLRHFRVERVASPTPLADVKGKWVLSGPRDSWSFSGTGYYFGKNLQLALGGPVGLVTAAWGGSTVDAWIGVEALARAGNARLSTHPSEQRTPSRLFNGMLAPLTPYSLAGVLWYQGEDDTWRPKDYQTLLPLMIDNWRATWSRPDLPFVICQLPLYGKRVGVPQDSAWARLREAQDIVARKTPRTSLVVLLDLGEEEDIHPVNKRDVGARAARVALADHYGRKVPGHGPAYRSMSVEGRGIRIHFSTTDDGLVAAEIPANYKPKTRDGRVVPLVRNSPDSELEGFSICGADRRWVWAQARIDGETVLVSAPEVAAPVAVRYAWAASPVFNLYSRSGLPAAPFRTDAFE